MVKNLCSSQKYHEMDLHAIKKDTSALISSDNGLIIKNGKDIMRNLIFFNHEKEGINRA